MNNKKKNRKLQEQFNSGFANIPKPPKTKSELTAAISLTKHAIGVNKTELRRTRSANRKRRNPFIKSRVAVKFHSPKKTALGKISSQTVVAGQIGKNVFRKNEGVLGGATFTKTNLKRKKVKQISAKKYQRALRAIDTGKRGTIKNAAVANVDDLNRNRTFKADVYPGGAVKPFKNKKRQLRSQLKGYKKQLRRLG